MTLAKLLASPGPVLIDGGLSTQLEVMGCRLTDALWTARVLLDDPEVITAAHRAFVNAGARIVIGASYQVSRRGFASAGLSSVDADRALTTSVRAARVAVGDTGALVAASVGPYGAITHDGGEYRGNYDVSEQELARFHAERVDVLRSAEPDLFAVETIPDVVEARALVTVLPVDVPAWISFTARDGAHLRAGQPIEDAVAAVADHPAVIGVGVNCTEPVHVPELLQRMRAVVGLPLVAYPNAGGSWDAGQRRWIEPQRPVGSAVRTWIDAGARVVGGCCGTDADAIRQMAAAIGSEPVMGEGH